MEESLLYFQPLCLLPYCTSWGPRAWDLSVEKPQCAKDAVAGTQDFTIHWHYYFYHVRLSHIIKDIRNTGRNFYLCYLQDKNPVVFFCFASTTDKAVKRKRRVTITIKTFPWHNNGNFFKYVIMPGPRLAGSLLCGSRLPCTWKAERRSPSTGLCLHYALHYYVPIIQRSLEMTEGVFFFLLPLHVCKCLRCRLRVIQTSLARCAGLT